MKDGEQKMEDVEKREVECPECGALIDVAEVEKYEVVFCHNCNGIFEFDGQALIELDG